MGNVWTDGHDPFWNYRSGKIVCFKMKYDRIIGSVLWHGKLHPKIKFPKWFSFERLL